jgi:hypothetical protein
MLQEIYVTSEYNKFWQYFIHIFIIHANHHFLQFFSYIVRISFIGLGILCTGKNYRHVASQ